MISKFQIIDLLIVIFSLCRLLQLDRNECKNTHEPASSEIDGRIELVFFKGIIVEITSLDDGQKLYDPCR